VLASVVFVQSIDLGFPENAERMRMGNPSFEKLAELAHSRWISLQRDSAFLIATVIIAQAAQAIIAFQRQIYPAFASPEVNPYPLVFARYQLVIILVLLVYYMAILLYDITFLCLRKQIEIERLLEYQVRQKGRKSLP